MKPHTTSLALVAVPASAARPSAAEDAAAICGLALESYPPRLVARTLGCSADLVTGWGRGKSSPSLVQILASPQGFRLRLLALAGKVGTPAELAPVPVRERLWLVMAACGALMATVKTWRSSDGLEDRSDAEIRDLVDNASKVEEEARKIREAGLRVLLDRRAREGGR